MNRIWLRFDASNSFPSQFRAVMVISLPATMKAWSTSTLRLVFGVDNNLVSEHHERLPEVTRGQRVAHPDVFAILKRLDLIAVPVTRVEGLEAFPGKYWLGCRSAFRRSDPSLRASAGLIG
ncbi:hypothetical protein ACWD4G_43110 [Streptomyces sp. NPDC002643]